jgi:CHRD domain
MRRVGPLLVTVTALGLAAAAGGARAEFEVAATLGWQQVVPKPSHPVKRASGSLTGDLDHQMRELNWKLVYRGLSGRPTKAEIHVGKLGRRGPLLLSLCGPKVAKARRCKSGLTGTKIVSKSAVLTLEAGNTYVQLYTRRNPRGEIRGQILIKR